jgi:hypothetical protein
MRKILVLVLALAACGRSIGDDCETNVQCSAQGDRQCDLSQPGGYCTVEGCDRTSCPDDAVCLRFFPVEALTMDCSAGAIVCSQRDICLPQEHFCVDPQLEHRFCMKPCSADGDCRDGYQCRQSGSGGAELLPDLQDHVATAKFCIERPVGPPPVGVDAAAMPDAPSDAPLPDGGADGEAADGGV